MRSDGGGSGRGGCHSSEKNNNNTTPILIHFLLSPVSISKIDALLPTAAINSAKKKKGGERRAGVSHLGVIVGFPFLLSKSRAKLLLLILLLLLLLLPFSSSSCFLLKYL